jgi:hypothetical protein
MQHYLVANRHIATHRQRLAEIGMQHAGILDVGARADADVFGIPADDVPNQTLASLSSLTRPMTSALSATQAVSSICGATPSSS